MEEREEQQNQTTTQEKETVGKSGKAGTFLGGLFAGAILVAVISVIIFYRTNVSLIDGKATTASTDTSSSNAIVNENVIKKLQLLETSVDQYYLGTISENAMEDSLYKGFMEGLGDPYSTYYSKEDLETVMESNEGIYYGIGAYIGMDTETDYCKVTKVMDHSPAEEAGVSDNDLLVAVDGEDMLGVTSTDIVTKIKGPENTQVVLTVYRKGDKDYRDITVTRRKIESPTVAYSMDENKIAYIQIAEFDEVTLDQFTEQLEQAKKGGMKGLILDLRDNPGGSVATVVGIAQELLPKGLIVYTEDKAGSRKEYTCDGKNEIQVPMVVLVNENSASASEILAGAIKDYKKGTILGTTTFGKGIVQKIFGISDGSAVKLTISHYYTPNGNDIHKVGIKPDEELKLDTDAYLKDRTDNQKNRATEILMEEIQ